MCVELDYEKVEVCHKQWAWLSVCRNTEVQTVNFRWAAGGGIETLLGVLRSRFRPGLNNSALSPSLRTQSWDKSEHIDSELPALLPGYKSQRL